jgi:DNA-binding transcriptional MerR regulator
MAGNYVKLFGSLLNSSAWCLPADTRLVWIALLLLADPEGRVWGAVPGIARQAGVSVEGARRALDELSSPDSDSRTPDEDGRRILPIDGGWQIVNARKYREMQTDGQRKASARSRAHRERKTNVTQRDERDASRPSRIETESETEEHQQKTDERNPAPAGAAPSRSDVLAVFDYWRERLHPSAKPLKRASKRYSRIRARLDEGFTVDQVKRAIEGCAGSPFHRENNHTDIELICRNAEKLERFIAMAPAGPEVELSPEERRRRRTQAALAAANAR